MHALVILEIAGLGVHSLRHPYTTIAMWNTLAYLQRWGDLIGVWSQPSVAQCCEEVHAFAGIMMLSDAARANLKSWRKFLQG